MMDKLIAKGEQLADVKTAHARSEVKSLLRDELPDHFSVEETGDGVAVKAKNLSDEIIDNSSIRDVAFLLRGVR